MSRVAHISAAGAGGGGGGGLTNAELRAAPVVVEGDDTPSDTDANPTDAVSTQSHSMFWESGAGTWKRWRSSPEGTPNGFVAPNVGLSLPDGFGVAGAYAQVGSVLSPLQSDGPDVSGNMAGVIVYTGAGRVYNATTFSDERARAADADGLTTGMPASGGYVFDGTNWDRARAGAPGADPGNVGIPAVQLHVSDGSNVRRVHSGLGDAASASTMVPSPGWLYNGATWDRARAGRATGSALADKVPSATAALTNVAGSASSVTLLAANAARRGATIMNDSSAILYVKFGTTASTTSFTVKMVADAYYEVPFDYTGRIDGIWASAAGSARITELSA